MRRRRIIMFFATMMSVAIFAVGFAAWIITSPTADSLNGGSITVETVTIEGWNFQAYWVNSEDYQPISGDDDPGKLSVNPEIYFGKPSGSTNGYIANENGAEEKLKAYLYVKAIPVTAEYDVNDTASIKLDFINAATNTKETEKNPLSVIDYSFGNATNGEDKTGIITNENLTDGVVITISFAWKTPELQQNAETGAVTLAGTYKNENPLTYYNGLNYYNSTVAQYAFEYLTAINTQLSGVSFLVTLSAVEAPVQP